MIDANTLNQWATKKYATPFRGKGTFYFTQERVEKASQLMAKRIHRGLKCTCSTLIAEAVDLLFEKEFSPSASKE